MLSRSFCANRAKPCESGRSTRIRAAMGIVVSLFAALGATTIVYAWLGQGGGVSGLVFFGILLAGATINAARTSKS